MASVTRNIKLGATKPDLHMTLSDGTGVLDVSVAAGVSSITIDIKQADGTVIRTAGTCSYISDGTDGRIKYLFVSPDTDTAGTHNFEINVNWSGGGITKFPDDGYGKLVVTADL